KGRDGGVPCGDLCRGLVVHGSVCAPKHNAPSNAEPIPEACDNPKSPPVAEETFETVRRGCFHTLGPADRDPDTATASQHAVDDTDDRAGRPNSEGQCRNGHGCETRAMTQQADSKPKSCSNGAIVSLTPARRGAVPIGTCGSTIALATKA